MPDDNAQLARIALVIDDEDGVRSVATRIRNGAKSISEIKGPLSMHSPGRVVAIAATGRHPSSFHGAGSGCGNGGGGRGSFWRGSLGIGGLLALRTNALQSFAQIGWRWNGQWLAGCGACTAILIVRQPACRGYAALVWHFACNHVNDAAIVRDSWASLA